MSSDNYFGKSETISQNRSNSRNIDFFAKSFKIEKNQNFDFFDFLRPQKHQKVKKNRNFDFFQISRIWQKNQYFSIKKRFCEDSEKKRKKKRKKNK